MTTALRWCRNTPVCPFVSNSINLYLLLQCHYSLVVCCVDDSKATLHNIALSRPAFQSSVYVDHMGTYPAGLANDGVFETHLRVNYVPRCAASNREANPWWAVDLGTPRLVHRVDLTNRGDNDGMKNRKLV